MLWRVFAANTVVFVVAFALVAWTPVTVHRVATGSEVVVLTIILILMLLIDLALLRRALGPLRRLAATIAAHDLPVTSPRADRSRGDVAQTIVGYVLTDGDHYSVFEGAAALLIGMFLGAVILMIGYVNVDSKRRGMNSLLWTLLVIFVPKALGFIAYFLLRKPLLMPCYPAAIRFQQCGRQAR